MHAIISAPSPIVLSSDPALNLHDWRNCCILEPNCPVVSCLLAQRAGCIHTNEMFLHPFHSTCVSLPVVSQSSPSSDLLSERRLQHRTDVAKLTFDLYKNNPKDFIGCLNVKATLYGVYSVSYDLRCYAAKKMLKWVKEPAKYLKYIFLPLCLNCYIMLLFNHVKSFLWGLYWEYLASHLKCNPVRGEN